MYQFLKDPGWVGAIIAVFSILITIVLHLKEKRNKELSRAVLNEEPLFTTSETLSGKFSILYEGQVVSNVYTITLLLKNIGNVAIRPEDFYEPIKGILNTEANILSIEVLTERPLSISVDIENQKNMFVIAPALVNAKDEIFIRMIVSDFKKRSLELYYRIAEVSTIRIITEKRPMLFYVWLLIVPCLSWLLTLFVDFIFFTRDAGSLKENFLVFYNYYTIYILLVTVVREIDNRFFKRDKYTYQRFH